MNIQELEADIVTLKSWRWMPGMLVKDTAPSRKWESLRIYQVSCYGDDAESFNQKVRSISSSILPLMQKMHNDPAMKVHYDDVSPDDVRNFTGVTQHDPNDDEAYPDVITISASNTIVPDLSDPATVGCIAGLARRLWGDPNMWAKHTPGVGWIAHFGSGVPMCAAEAPSEAHAWCEAISVKG